MYLGASRPFTSFGYIHGNHSFTNVRFVKRRAGRILQGMGMVISHDLPNELVVLQSLLQMLSDEEPARLSNDWREYVRRSQNAARRAGDLVRFLKEMGRLNTLVGKTETINLADLARELQGELQQRYPDKQFEFAWHWSVATIVGDARAYRHGIVELFAALLQPHPKQYRVSASSKRHSDEIELAFCLAPAPTFAVGKEERTLEQRMEFMLAREWLALLGQHRGSRFGGGRGLFFCPRASLSSPLITGRGKPFAS